MLKITLHFSASKPQYSQYQKLLETICKENRTVILLLCLCISKGLKVFLLKKDIFSHLFSLNEKTLSLGPKITY